MAASATANVWLESFPDRKDLMYFTCHGIFSRAFASLEGGRREIEFGLSHRFLNPDEFLHLTDLIFVLILPGTDAEVCSELRAEIERVNNDPDYVHWGTGEGAQELREELGLDYLESAERPCREPAKKEPPKRPRPKPVRKRRFARRK